MKYFSVKELVDKKTYEELGEASIELLSPRLIDTIETLRELLGMNMLINNWYHGGLFQQRGYRSIDSGVGKVNGAHYKGMAVDFDCYKNGKLQSADSIREKIYDYIISLPHIRCIEIDVSWIHIDVMGEEDSDKRKGVNEKKILLYSPITGSKVINRNDL
jgi:hypothetical protein